MACLISLLPVCKKKTQIVSRSYDIALQLCGETGVYDRVLHTYLSAFVITAPIAVAMDHYLAVILTPQPSQCTSRFLFFVEVSYE